MEFELSKSSNRAELQSLRRQQREASKIQKDLEDRCAHFMDKSTEWEEKYAEAAELSKRAVADRNQLVEACETAQAQLSKLQHLEKAQPVKDSMIKDLEYRIDAMALKQNDVKLELTSKLAKAMHESVR